MTRLSPTAVPRRLGALRALMAVVTALTLGLLALVPSAQAATKVLTYHGLRLRVPAGWPVYNLARDPGQCVRFDRHAVYLGTPGTRQSCPAHAAGRTEAILLSPLGAQAAAAANDASGPLAPPASSGASPAGGSASRLVDTRHGVEVFATWNHEPDLIRNVLGVRRLPALTDTPAQRRAAALSTVHATRSPSAAKATASAPGSVYTGPGFDACSTPSPSQMSAWGSSPYRAIGVYLGGTNMACSQPQLTASWVSQETSAGWHLIPIYVGLQAPGNSCSCSAISTSSAASQGTAAAADAVVHAQSIGLGTGNPIYFDMEAYPRGGTHTSTVLAFLAAWTQKLHASGYASGVYASDDSGVEDLVAQVGTGYAEPDDLWMANWNGVQSTADSRVPAGDWPNHQRLHQYSGGTNETYGGVKINVDGDYIDAATASPGAGAVSLQSATPPTPPASPSLSVVPAADGSITLRPTWSGGPAVSSWQILAGPSAAVLSPATNPIEGSSAIVVHSSFPYFAVRALDATGAVLATSTAVSTPAHLTLAGSTAFVPRQGPGGLPVGCYKPTSCHVSATLSVGRLTVARTGSETVPFGGGMLLFKLTPAGRRDLTHSHHLSVRATVRDVSGLTAVRNVNLVAFSTSGRSPARSVAQSPSIHLVGLTDYVSNGWVGGILSSCRSNAACRVQLTILSGKTVIARSGNEFLGANEMGYLTFSLTAAGHRLLTRAPGNQLVARVLAANGSDRVNARVVLVAFH